MGCVRASRGAFPRANTGVMGGISCVEFMKDFVYYAGLLILGLICAAYLIFHTSSSKSGEESFMYGTVVDTYRVSHLFTSDSYYITVEDETDSGRRMNVRVKEPTYIIGDKVIIRNDFDNHWLISSEEERAVFDKYQLQR